MSITFLVPLLFSSPHDTCSTRGMPLFEIRERSEISASITTTKIFASGAWTVRGDGGAVRGCFDRKELRMIRKALHSAPWRTTTSPIACFAYDPNFTEYVVHGELLFTERMCSGTTADFRTQRAIELVKQELADEGAVAPKPPPPPPPKPPVDLCRVSGTPVFEIHKLSDRAESTSTIAIYATGAWTLQPFDAHGRAGALQRGCFDAPTTSKLRHLVDDAPWDTTLSRIVCRAYSPRFTEYYVHGKLEYTSRVCGAERLDEQSLAVIEKIDAELAEALPRKM